MRVEVREPPVGFGFGFLLLPYGSGKQTQVLSLGSKDLYPLGRLMGLGSSLKKLIKMIKSNFI